MTKLIPISKALSIVGRETRALAAEEIKLAMAVGRVLAEEVLADSDMPPFDRSQMDGYAVKAKDTANAPVELKIVGESAAGRGWHDELKKGEAVRIMTGARVPKGADSVQKIELTNESGDMLTVNEPTGKGRYIVRKGAEMRKGSRLFRPGEWIDEKMIASLAAFGYATLRVAVQPTVSILATGSEIVAVDKLPAVDQIRNSNSVMLKAMCEKAGSRPKVLPGVGDNLSRLVASISGACRPKSAIRSPRSEILILTGGVSVGKYDLTKAALRELGAEIFFERVRLKPGKPTVFGRLNETLVFGLPGNPVSAAVTFYLFVRTAILRMQGAGEDGLREGHAVLGSNAKAARERDTYLPATLSTDKTGRLVATPLRWLGSSDFVGFAKANALVFVPRGASITKGEVARILFI